MSLYKYKRRKRLNNENGITDKLKLTGVKNPDGSGDNLSYTLRIQ